MELIEQNKAHWANPTSYDPNWDTRAAAAATLIPPRASVCEIGCGARFSIEKHLVRPAAYFPCDMTQWEGRVELCDFNEGKYPERAAAACDTVVLLGVIEYLADPAKAFDWLCANFNRMVFSYCPTTMNRYRHPLWISHLNIADIISLMRSRGFPKLEVHDYDPHQIVFAAERQPTRKRRRSLLWW